MLATAFLLGALQESPSVHYSAIYYAVLPIAGWLGVNLIRSVLRRDGAAADVLSRDHRAPVVYRRSFQQDDDLLLIPWFEVNSSGLSMVERKGQSS